LGSQAKRKKGGVSGSPKKQKMATWSREKNIGKYLLVELPGGMITGVQDR